MAAARQQLKSRRVWHSSTYSSVLHCFPSFPSQLGLISLILIKQSCILLIQDLDAS